MSLGIPVLTAAYCRNCAVFEQIQRFAPQGHHLSPPCGSRSRYIQLNISRAAAGIDHDNVGTSARQRALTIEPCDTAGCPIPRSAAAHVRATHSKNGNPQEEIMTRLKLLATPVVLAL